jgi:hypothetical protein
MAETAGGGDDAAASGGMRLRTRRSAMADISNVVSQISDAAKRVVSSGTKRKSVVSSN